MKSLLIAVLFAANVSFAQRVEIPTQAKNVELTRVSLTKTVLRHERQPNPSNCRYDSEYPEKCPEFISVPVFQNVIKVDYKYWAPKTQSVYDSSEDKYLSTNWYEISFNIALDSITNRAALEVFAKRSIISGKKASNFVVDTMSFQDSSYDGQVYIVDEENSIRCAWDAETGNYERGCVANIVYKAVPAQKRELVLNPKN